jgi:hypothetical protein
VSTTDVLAIVGAATGVPAAIHASWSIYHSAFRDREKLKVSAQLQGGTLSIKVLNDGRRPTTVVTMGVMCERGVDYQSKQGLPKQLDEKQFHEVTFRLRLPEGPGEKVLNGPSVFCYAADAGGRVVKAKFDQQTTEVLLGKYIDQTPLTVF